MTTDDDTTATTALEALEPLDDIDRRILAAARETIARLDPVPAGLTDRIKFDITLAALHAEIADLERMPLAGVRGGDTAYTPTESVTFTSSSLSLMVTLTPDRSSGAATSHSGPMVRIDGWVTAGGATVELFVGGRTFTALSDDHLRFIIDGVPRGSARFVLRAPGGDGRPVITPSLEI